MRDEVEVGDIVRVEWSTKRPVDGVVVGQSHNGTCWVVLTLKGEDAFHKSHCKRIVSSAAGKGVRRIRQARKVREANKARSVLVVAGIVRNFGDGDLD